MHRIAWQEAIGGIFTTYNCVMNDIFSRYQRFNTTSRNRSRLFWRISPEQYTRPMCALSTYYTFILYSTSIRKKRAAAGGTKGRKIIVVGRARIARELDVVVYFGVGEKTMFS